MSVAISRSRSTSTSPSKRLSNSAQRSVRMTKQKAGRRKKFEISIEPIEDLTDRSYRLCVTVHPTLAEMRRAARKAHPEAAEHLVDAGGCFRIAPGVKAGRTFLGTMRLAEECLTPWVVMHEAVHAGVALAFSECNRGYGTQPFLLDPYLGGGWADREELIAYGAHAFAFGIMAELGLINDSNELGHGA